MCIDSSSPAWRRHRTSIIASLPTPVSTTDGLAVTASIHAPSFSSPSSLHFVSQGWAGGRVNEWEIGRFVGQAVGNEDAGRQWALVEEAVGGGMDRGGSRTGAK